MTSPNTQLSSFAIDTLKGLSSSPKRLFSKYFYDKKGDKLFQDIMAMPEYYLTNCEYEIFSTQKEQILKFAENKSFDLVELGAGDGTKTKVLLEYLIEQEADFQYVPIDISKNALEGLSCDLKKMWPQLSVNTMQGDYFQVLERLSHIGDRPKLVLFLGGNIGNFTPEQAQDFLMQLRGKLNRGDRLLLGADLKKDPAIIQKAYDDPAGITAAFNLNLLDRMNRELGANFDIAAFKHWETYNPVTGATKSYIVSKKEQTVHFADFDKTFSFAAWEGVWVELSQKYDFQMLENIAEKCGFAVENHFTDKKQYFTDTLWRV